MSTLEGWTTSRGMLPSLILSSEADDMILLLLALQQPTVIHCLERMMAKQQTCGRGGEQAVIVQGHQHDQP